MTGAVAGFNFILNRLNLLASPNLLEVMCLYEAVGERSRGRRGTGATLSQLGPLNFDDEADPTGAIGYVGVPST